MPSSLNNVTAPVDYDDEFIVTRAGAAGIFLHVSGQPIYLERRLGDGDRWTDERFIPPGGYLRAFVGTAARFKRAVASLPTQVTIELLDAAEFAAGGSVTAFTQTINESGAVSLPIAFYTLAQWPPVGAVRNDIVVLADTYDGVGFLWALEYRNDEDGVFPWKRYNGAGELGWIAKGFTDNDTADPPSAGWFAVSIGGSRTKTRFRVPRAGHYEVAVRAEGFAASGAFGSGDLGVGIDATGASNPAPATFDTQAADHQTREHSVASLGPFNVGDYAQVMKRDSGAGLSVYYRALTLLARPAKIA